MPGPHGGGGGASCSNAETRCIRSASSSRAYPPTDNPAAGGGCRGCTCGCFCARGLPLSRPPPSESCQRPPWERPPER
eukprot:476067-Prymnesium_polylepis.1